eukprot:CAMPEP_0185257660 /NCGR_PEP_ID=MMETSP1359-20130426/6700_1 /TAXON_ID=552665 /ORGANISM="Bigelowiella longifila, Strain CCMP242" /LENGTH=215 /DNA_ID=CAMNT_0027842845 /DNA_START=158 /DNA_END=805 /DNA_ORIENTATION=-
MAVRDMDNESFVSMHTSDTAMSVNMEPELSLRLCEQSSVPYHTKTSNRKLTDSEFVRGLTQEISDDTVTTISTLSDDDSSDEFARREINDNRKRVRFYESEKPNRLQENNFRHRRYPYDDHKHGRMGQRERPIGILHSRNRIRDDGLYFSEDDGMHVPHFVKEYVKFGGEQMAVEDEDMKRRYIEETRRLRAMKRKDIGMCSTGCSKGSPFCIIS